MRQFFLDTANVDFIENYVEKTRGMYNRKQIVGVTTNPNAFYKVGLNKLSEWIERTKVLCEVVADIRGDDLGVVYVQLPNCDMQFYEIIQYAKLLSSVYDGYAKIGLKIPPYTRVLKLVDELNQYVETNVTGIADVGTALKCLSYNVRYVSIIPGRMEEVKIDARSQLAFLRSSAFSMDRVITGSMRTVEQVEYCFQYGTVPTIGEKVLDLVYDSGKMSSILSYTGVENVAPQFCPDVNIDNLSLSLAFFESMNKLGEEAYKEFTEKYNPYQMV
jgi:transaldolase